MPGIVLFNVNEINDWKQALLEKRLLKKQKACRCFDPRLKKLKEYRHHRRTKYIYGNESKFIRNMTQRKFRRAMKREILREEYYRPVPHDYKTYGWLTW
ncbi:hypothetical protein [Cohnella silvisoli]|uniref:Uncharacterized protein n=1 Tax=Cohnella silvisoli TaxID=2873699 RepID=A0ABV1KQJ6_9BACL|nr:hypothetical protein [Cohnella silvisoli]MCD9021998.1 hypothetical protein [Cohnella silvisoli]